MNKYTVFMMINGMSLSISGIVATSPSDAIAKAKIDALHNMGYSSPKKLKARLEK